eukprot:s2641_g2.t1
MLAGPRSTPSLENEAAPFNVLGKGRKIWYPMRKCWMIQKAKFLLNKAVVFKDLVLGSNVGSLFGVLGTVLEKTAESSAEGVGSWDDLQYYPSSLLSCGSYAATPMFLLLEQRCNCIAVATSPLAPMSFDRL